MSIFPTFISIFTVVDHLQIKLVPSIAYVIVAINLYMYINIYNVSFDC